MILRLHPNVLSAKEAGCPVSWLRLEGDGGGTMPLSTVLLACMASFSRLKA